MSTMNIRIKRIYQKDCTIGILSYGDFRCFTLELPYDNNQRGISAIPKGLYPCSKYTSSKFGPCIAVDGVNGRDHIRIHKGNYTYQIQGCILPGESLKDMDGDGIPDVTNSTKTLDKLLSLLPDNFWLEIE